MNIIVSGMIAGVPRQGGAVWAVLQYLLGFRRLGHDVCFIEPVDQAALTPEAAKLEDSTNANYFRGVLSTFGLEKDAALWLRGTKQTAGLEYDQMLSRARKADLLIDISGMLNDEDLAGRIPLRVYLDLDPAFNQLWHTVEGIDMHLSGHTHFVTVGLAVGQPGCLVPTCGLEWITTVPPVVLEHWPFAEFLTHNALTTVANWRGYGSIEHDGVFFGLKAHSLRKFVELPTLTTERFTLALAIHPDENKDLDALEFNGWELLDPGQTAATPSRYHEFVQGSKAEFGIAKSGYVASCSGWFSDRSACYLASGRPVLAQDTGFSRFLPAGEGLFAFRNKEDVLAEIEQMNRDYVRQRHAARAIAKEYLDSDRVLGQMLSAIGAAP